MLKGLAIVKCTCMLHIQKNVSRGVTRKKGRKQGKMGVEMLLVSKPLFQ